MELLALTVGPIQENCYFLIGENRDTIIFDPGAEADEIMNVIDVNNLKPFAIVLTHAHYDHIGAVNEIRKEYRIPLYQSSIEKEWLVDPTLNGSGRQPLIPEVVIDKPADFYLDTMGPTQIGPFNFELQHLPGHSPGSLVFLFKENGFAIVGDVIFQGSIGRTDFPYGSQETLLQGIKEHIVPLPGDTVLFPGHGNPTTVEQELAQNPFLNGEI
ncbi:MULTISPECIES: MBL fold metallo-hydrolase [unclassified Jeotgalibaca]|uniref:MBL fold metallo-hydrolase n=1 Tax=unclassified Jeotgalibaca TaxID=2621505 RepID=UPI003FD6B11D